MAEKISLDPDRLEVMSFATTFSTTTDAQRLPGGDASWPDVCTCIGICQPSEDIYCSGGCPPEYPAAAY